MSSLHNLTILNSLSLHNLNTKYYTKPVLSVHYEMTACPSVRPVNRRLLVLCTVVQCTA